MINPNNTEQKFPEDVIKLIKDSLNKSLACPFENVNFTLPNNVPCPVCGSLGGFGDGALNVYCLDDFRPPVKR